MKLNTVYARFYKSFNFDHLRKAHPKAEPKPWETFEGAWFPYVEVPIDKRITAIVGANESGKSHLLNAIEKAISGEGFKQRDLCRYSSFFNVEKGKTCWPHLGVSWTHVTNEEVGPIKSAVDGGPSSFEEFLMFREGPDVLTLFLPDGDGGFSDHRLEGDAARSFGQEFLPRPFRIKPDIALPNFVPLDWLVEPNQKHAALASRRMRMALMGGAKKIDRAWFANQNHFTQQAGNVFNALESIFGPHGSLYQSDDGVSPESLDLARALLVQLANVEPDRLKDLSEAIADGEDGHANALIPALITNSPNTSISRNGGFRIEISPCA